jgi:dephospho-CoA kinase
MLRIGLTGGIGTGKTTVSDMFGKLGARIIDADVIVHELSSAGMPAYKAIIDMFGPDVVDESGGLLRKVIRQRIFANAQLKAKLEALLHPLVRAEIDRQVAENSRPYCIISIPLLFETGSAYNIDRILVVDAPQEVQIARACGRDNADREAIQKIINLQSDREFRIARADDVICNDADLASLQAQVNSLHEKYMQLANDRRIPA